MPGTAFLISTRYKYLVVLFIWFSISLISIEFYKVLLRSNWILLSLYDFHNILWSSIAFSSMPLNSMEIYCILLYFIEFHWVRFSSVKNHCMLWNSNEFNWISLHSNEFYWFLFTFIEFHWSLVNSIKFHWIRCHPAAETPREEFCTMPSYLLLPRKPCGRSIFREYWERKKQRIRSETKKTETKKNSEFVGKRVQCHSPR